MEPAMLAPARRVGNNWEGAARRVLMPNGRRAYRSRAPRGARLLRLLTVLAALAAGMLCGLYDLHTGNTPVTALLVGTASLAFALVSPHAGLFRAVVVGLGVPLLYVCVWALQIPVQYPPANLAATLLAVLPALAGALTGILIRQLADGRARSLVQR